MKNVLNTIVGLAVAATLISACATKETPAPEEPPQQEKISNQASRSQVPVRSTPTPTPGRPSAEEFQVTPVSTPTPTPEVKDYPSGVSVSDRPGYVRSPYAPDLGLVDVRGIPPGTEVRDPYTGRIFLVP